MFWTPTVVFIAQLISTFIIGLVVPLIIAFQWWRRSHHATIPFMQMAILSALSLFFMFIFPLPLIGMGFAYLGATPGASLGITVGWAIVAIILWPALKALFGYLSKRGKKSK